MEAPERDLRHRLPLLGEAVGVDPRCRVGCEHVLELELGVVGDRPLEEDLDEFTDGLVEFERIAVTPAQIEEWDLPTRPTKKTDTRAKNFDGESVELDAIPAPELRELVRDEIELHVDQHQLEVLRIAEAEESRVIEQMAASLNGDVS